ncbi:RHO1 GDP-GTP exchange protein 2 [Basidiobolus ranarum]|uniref:RHO1 GDP-GTP exchange protein 2 n=1 Tax=Basidiobolus ranarum TaxID=34480 RepID=A0ABR2W7C9_9FUNG
MPYTTPPKPPNSSELLEELATTTQYWSLKEKENASENTHFYPDSNVVAPQYGFPYPTHGHMMAPQHEYYGVNHTAYQPSFPSEHIREGYDYLNPHYGGYGFGLNPYGIPHFPPTTYTHSDPGLYNGMPGGGVPHNHFPERFTQLSSPCEETLPYPSHPLRMPDPSDYLSDNSLRHISPGMNPYHTPEAEQKPFMTIPDPRDYQSPRTNIDPYDPALLPTVREGLLKNLADKYGPNQTNEYFDCFSGHELVDSICDVLDGVPRETALLIGRLLQEHGVFSHVSTNNRTLMDNDQEFYKLGNTNAEEEPKKPEMDSFESYDSTQTVESQQDLIDVQGIEISPTQADSLNLPKPNDDLQTVDNEGVDTTLQAADTPLYTSTNVIRKPTELIRQSTNEYENLWIASIPDEIIGTLSDKERSRQIAIFEIIYTEEEYLRDLKLYDSLFIEPLRSSRVFNSDKTDRFVQDVFMNYQDLQQLHEEVLAAFKEHQSVKPIVEIIGDVVVQFIERFEPYILFSKGSVNSGRVLKNERAHSSGLESFLEECQKKPEARKLPLESFLSRPTSRIARYPLLLDRVLKYTPEDNVDRQMLVSAIGSIREFLNKLNEETGRAENRLRLQEIGDKIEFKSEDYVDLKLNEADRQLIREGVLKRSIGHGLRLILFDHILLLAKDKKSFTTSNITYRVYARPIPLEFLSLQTHSDDAIATGEDTAKTAYPFSITNLSKWGGTYTLIASSLAERKQWFDRIREQQAKRMYKCLRIFELVSISDRRFDMESRALCTSSYTTRDGKRKIAIGTINGLYTGFEGDPASFCKVLTLERVRQVEVLEQIDMVLVLQDKLLLTYSTDILDLPKSSVNCHGQKLASQVSFFNAGLCQGKLLVVVLKLKGLKSYFKVLEPVSLRENPKIKGKLLCQRNGFALRLYKEFYIGAESYSVQFLTKKLYVVCPRGFEIVNLDALHLNKSIPDLEDESQFGFISKRENCRPLAMFSLNKQEFLLCYNEFAFHLDNVGRRTRPNLTIEWEGRPTSVALHGHFIIAFDPSFMEIRDAESGELVQIINGYDLRCLNPSSHKHGIFLGMEPFRKHEQYVFQLLWNSHTTSNTEDLKDPLVRKLSEEDISEF